MNSTNITIGLPVRSLSEARAWYTTLCGDRKAIQPVPHIVEYEIEKGVWLQLIEDPALAPGDGALRFGVRDIHGEKVRLAAAGIEVGEIQEIPGVILLCCFADPFGNRLSLYQEI